MRLRNSRVPRRPTFGLLAAALATAALGIVGCTSEAENGVGSGLVGPRIDTLLVPLEIGTVDSFGNFTVYDEKVPFNRQQVLYLGLQGAQHSEILLRYDFDAVRDSLEARVADPFAPGIEIPEIWLRFYSLVSETGYPTKAFRVQELVAPLDTTLYPGEHQEVLDVAVVTTGPMLAGSEFKIDINRERLRYWLEVAAPPGLMVSEYWTASSDTGLIGVGSKENRFGATALGDGELAPGTVIGPILHLKLVDGLDEYYFNIKPADDLCTLAELDPIPAAPDAPGGGFALQTVLRSYPYLSFDLGALPDNAVINRAQLWLGLDNENSYTTVGKTEALVVSEIAAATMALAADSISVDELGDLVRVVDGRTGIDVKDDEANSRIFFNVTASIQRMVNRQIDADFAFLLSPADKFTPTYDLSRIPTDFYLVRFAFRGSGDPDPDLRPQLKILYSRIADLTGGER